MQLNGRYDRLFLGLKDRSRPRGFRLLFSDRKQQASVAPEPLPKASPGLDLDLDRNLLAHFAAASLDSSGSNANVDLDLVLFQVTPVVPPAQQQHLQQQQHPHRHLSAIGEASGSNMDESIQERQTLMASLADVSDETKSQCRINVLELFCDMDPDHLSRVCEQGRWIPEDIIRQVVNDMEDDNPYPKIQKLSLKRKRDDKEDATTPESEAKKWDNVGRRNQARDPKSSYTRMRSVFSPYMIKSCRCLSISLCVTLILFSHSILQQFFPQLYVENLKSFMSLNGGILYPTYLLLSKATAKGDEANPLFRKKKGRVPRTPPLLAGILDERIRDCRNDGEREALQEVRAARIAEQIEAAGAIEARRKEKQELENFETAKAEGTIADCGCCFVEYAINRMVHCDGEEVHVSASVPILCHAVSEHPAHCSPSLSSSSVEIVPGLWQKHKSVWPSTTWTACLRTAVLVALHVVSARSFWTPSRERHWNRSRWMLVYGRRGSTTSKLVHSVPMQQ